MCFSPLRFTRRTVTHGVSNHKLSLKCFFILIVFKELVPHETKIARENMVNFLFQRNLFSPFDSRSHSSPTSGKFYPDCSIGQDPVLDFQNIGGEALLFLTPFVTEKKASWIHTLALLANVSHEGEKKQSVSRRVIC